jgi:diaminopimelate decarboxylase
LAGAAAGAPLQQGLSVVEEIDRSLAVGAGLVAPDLRWAIGHAWRVLYPAIVQRLGDGGLREDDWPAFHRLAAEMERVAFGPSPLNAAKLLALVEAGLVDLSLVAGATLRDREGRTCLCGADRERPVDVVVDAVLPGPGVLPGQDALLDGLVADGHVRIAHARRGLDIALDGTCLSRDGSCSLGLAAIGRPTEDVVIGNDTLSRTLHPLSDRWARRVVERGRAYEAEAIEREHAAR